MTDFIIQIEPWIDRSELKQLKKIGEVRGASYKLDISMGSFDS